LYNYGLSNGTITGDVLVTLTITIAVWNLCVHKPWWFAYTMARWQCNTRCHQQHW